MNRVNSIVLAAMLTMGLSSVALSGTALAGSRFEAGARKATLSTLATLSSRSTRMLGEAHALRISDPGRASTLASEAVSHEGERPRNNTPPAHVSLTMQKRANRIIATARNEIEIRALEEEAETGELRKIQPDTMGHSRVDSIASRLGSSVLGMEAIQRPRFQAAAAEVILDSNTKQIELAKKWLADVRNPGFKDDHNWAGRNARTSADHLVSSAAYRTPFEGQLRKNHPRKFATMRSQREEMLDLENQIRAEMTKRNIR